MVQTLEIQQLNVQYNVARSLDSPAAIQQRLDRIASQRLAQALADQLAQVNDTDDALYFIETLKVDLPLELTLGDDHQLAQIWAGELYRSILRSLGSSVWFCDRKSFIASFLEDLLLGQAWDYWYYGEFSSLRSTSVGLTIQAVLLEDGDIGRDALLELTRRNRLEPLLARLSDGEVTAIANFCFLPPSPRLTLPQTYAVWLSSLRSLLQRNISLTAIPARDLTSLYLTLLQQQPKLGPDVNLARFIYDILELRQTVMAMEGRADFLTQLASENWTQVFRQLGHHQGQSVITALRREVSGTAIAALLQDLQVENPPLITQRILTPYGGIFLLVGAIVDLQLYDFLQTVFPDPWRIPDANWLLWLIALQCLGRQNAPQAKTDRALAFFAGLSSIPTLSDCQDYAAVLTSARQVDCDRKFQDYLQTLRARSSLFNYHRVLAADLLPAPTWLSAGEPLLPDPLWDTTLAMISATIVRGFALKLGTLGDSSPSYLCRNFLESQAEIEVSSAQIHVRFLTCPLQMVLRMAGFDDLTWEIPWLDNRQLTFEFN